MKHLLALIIFLGSAIAVQAACFADYKAKMDNPLRLQYGVAAIDGACTKRNAEQQLQARLSAGGWQLLNVIGVFEEDGLEERKASAGANFLRY